MRTDLEEFKTLVTDVLTQHASAILLDPEFGLPASKHRHGKGLLLAYEKTGYDATTPGRLPDLLDVWSVRRLKEAGADCIKILLYYTPFEKSHINDLKHAWIERIGDECLAHDIPFFLEFVGYDAEGGDEKSLEYAKKKPEIVSGAMAEFGKARYNVDVLKVEVPIEMAYVEGTQGVQGRKGVYARRGAGALPAGGDDDAQAIHLSVGGRVEPGVYRDAGAGGRSRARSSTACCAAARRGRTALRSIAKQGADAFRQWLNTTGVENIENVNRGLQGCEPVVPEVRREQHG